MAKHTVSFSARGEGNPDVITSAIGIEPSYCNSHTDINPATGQPWGVMRWVLDSGEPPDAPVQQHVDSLLLWLSRRTAAVRALADDFELLIQVGCYSDDRFVLHLTRDQTRMLGRLGIAFDYDGYVSSEPGQGEPGVGADSR